MAGENFSIGVTPRANYPAVKRVGDFVYVSGLSARRPDNSFRGASTDELGTLTLDIREQTEGTIANIGEALALAGASLDDLVQVTVWLVSMNDFGGMNEVYNRHFRRETGPTRTTVAVHQLPHPHMLVEMTAVAWSPRG